MAVILDGFSRKVVGWALERTLATRLPKAALAQAIANRQPPPGLVHHSDRVVQYASDEYVKVLQQHQMLPSMSRPANPYDNASCESFMKTLKREEIYANDLCGSRSSAHEHRGLRPSPGRTALFVIDMQRYFVEPNYPFGQTWAKVVSDDALAYFERVSGTVIPNVHALLSRCRELGIPVYFTAFGSLRDDGRDLPGWERQHNLLSQQMVGKPMYPACSDPSWQIHDSLRPAPGEQVVAKTTSGPLNSTKLDQTLRLLGVDTIVATGVVTNVCVTQTAREFADRGFTVVVPEDACSTLGEERHRGALWRPLRSSLAAFPRQVRY